MADKKKNTKNAKPEKALEEIPAAIVEESPKPAAPAFDPYPITVTASVLNVRKGPGPSYPITTRINRGEVYIIAEEQNGWGKLKSGAGWVFLAYVQRG